MKQKDTIIIILCITLLNCAGYLYGQRIFHLGRIELTDGSDIYCEILEEDSLKVGIELLGGQRITFDQKEVQTIKEGRLIALYPKSKYLFIKGSFTIFEGSISIPLGKPFLYETKSRVVYNSKKISLLQGYQLTPAFGLGFGIGYKQQSYFVGRGFESAAFQKEKNAFGAMPLFVDARGVFWYFKRKAAMFYDIRAGVNHIGKDGHFFYRSGTSSIRERSMLGVKYFNFSVGVIFASRKKHKLSLRLGLANQLFNLQTTIYTNQIIQFVDEDVFTRNELELSLGVQF